MTVVAVVPMRHNSERVVGKNFRILGGRPLYHHILEVLLSIDSIDQVVIDTDSDVIMADAGRVFPQVALLERPPHLRAGDIPMNDVLLNTLERISADIVLQTHSTNPFLGASTIQAALDSFVASRDHFDSAFGVTRIQNRFWTAQGAPLNHDPRVLARTQDLEPIFLENSCFYIFPPETIHTNRNRIGRSPLMVEVPAMEAIDIDDESDWTLAIAIEAMRSVA